MSGPPQIPPSEWRTGVFRSPAPSVLCHAITENDPPAASHALTAKDRREIATFS